MDVYDYMVNRVGIRRDIRREGKYLNDDIEIPKEKYWMGEAKFFSVNEEEQARAILGTPVNKVKKGG